MEKELNSINFENLDNDIDTLLSNLSEANELYKQIENTLEVLNTLDMAVSKNFTEFKNETNNNLKILLEDTTQANEQNYLKMESDINQVKQEIIIKLNSIENENMIINDLLKIKLDTIEQNNIDRHMNLVKKVNYISICVFVILLLLLVTGA